MKCSRYGNGGRMHVILNGEPLQEVDCFKSCGRKWQLMEDVKGMWYTELIMGKSIRALKSVRSTGLRPRSVYVKELLY